MAKPLKSIHFCPKFKREISDQGQADRERRPFFISVNGKVKMRFTIFLLFFLSLCTHASGQLSWPAYSESASQGVKIQNSLPKGGTRYTDFAGKNFGYVVFWNRVVNETATPVEVTIKFPGDSFAIPNSPMSYLKLFLPPDTMTYSKQVLYNYGLTGLESFLDTAFNKPTMLQRTINPKEECVFYIAAVSYMPVGGAIRAEFVLKERDIFYKINILDSALIPCGQIIFKR